MMGKDIERILSGIDSVKEAASKSIVSLSNATAYRINTPDDVQEKEVPVSASSFTNPVSSSMSGMSGDCASMASLKGGMYTNACFFNNSYGSPWTELEQLTSTVQDMNNFASAHSELKFVGEKAALLGLINRVMSAAVDARWAIMHFHDYVQRGYDHVYNGDVPSITFADGSGKDSVGNIDHKYDDNVRVPPKPTYPF